MDAYEKSDWNISLRIDPGKYCTLNKEGNAKQTFEVFGHMCFVAPQEIDSYVYGYR
jgi:hypothetical protein